MNSRLRYCRVTDSNNYLDLLNIRVAESLKISIDKKKRKYGTFEFPYVKDVLLVDCFGFLKLETRLDCIKRKFFIHNLARKKKIIKVNTKRVSKSKLTMKKFIGNMKFNRKVRFK